MSSRHMPVPGSAHCAIEDDFEFQACGSLPQSLPEHYGVVVGSPALWCWQRHPSSMSLALAEEEDPEVGSNAEVEQPTGVLTTALVAGDGSLTTAVAAAGYQLPGRKGQPPEHPHLIASACSPSAFDHTRSEAMRILRLAAPLSISNLAGFAISMVVIAATGHLGEEPLSVVVLATSVFNVTGLSVLIGFSSAMETFCGQAVGAGRYHLVGLVLQRALLLLTLLAALVAALWTQTEGILLLLGQDPAIAYGTAQFLLRATPALWFTGVFEALKRYLMSQEAVRPATMVTVISLCLSPLYNWLLIYRFGLGLYGAAYAMDAMQATLAILLAAYCVARDRLLHGSPAATWHGFSAKAWTGWRQYCRFALPSVAMLCTEWSTFEVMVLMSGLLPDPKVSVSVMGLCIQTSGLCYMIVTGLACAASVRVSNSLGARMPEAARRATWTAWGQTMCLQTVVALGVVLTRDAWPRLFTNSPAVIARTAHLLPLFALSLFGDGTNAVLQGLLRGAGKQETGAITNLLSYWCCGIPLAAYLAFKRGMGLDGLWWGLVVINTMQGVIMLTLTALFDFQKQSDKAVAMLAQHAARLQMDGVGEVEEESNPLLAPLLSGEHGGTAAGGSGEAAGSSGAASKARMHGRRGGSSRPVADPAGIRERLRESVLLLLTEGAHVQPRRRLPSGYFQRTQDAPTAAVALEP